MTEPVVSATLTEIDETRIAEVAAIIVPLRLEVEDRGALAFIQYAVVVDLQWLLGRGDPRKKALVTARYKLIGLSHPVAECVNYSRE